MKNALFLIMGLGLWAGSLNAAPPKSTHYTNAPYPGGSVLPSKYHGVDPQFLWTALRERTKAIGPKGEFETVEAYQQRLKSEGSHVGPFDTSSLVALKIDASIYYSADKQSYYTDRPTYCQKEPGRQEEYLCDWATVERNRSSYTGGNAFGAQSRVSETRSKDLGVLIDQQYDFFKAITIGMIEESPSFLDLTGLWPVPVEKAKQHVTKDLGVLLVGRMTSGRLIEGRVDRKRPTFQSPTDSTTENFAVPFEPLQLVLYNVKTGEILQSQPASPVTTQRLRYGIDP